MSDQTSNLIACASTGRRFFYDRVGRYFFKPEKPANTDTCPQCGASSVLLEQAGKSAACYAYRAIVAKRHSPADGHPIAYGAPLRDPNKRGMTTFGESAYALIEEDRSYVACNLLPVEPLPNSMTAVRTGVREYRRIINRLLETPPTKPFLFVAFSRAADFEMRMSMPGDVVWLSRAPFPVAFSLTALKKALEFHEANSADLKTLSQLGHLRHALSAGDSAAGQRINAILSKKPALANLFADLPDSAATETQLAASLFYSAQREAEAVSSI